MRSSIGLSIRHTATLALAGSALVLGVAVAPAGAAGPACRTGQLVAWIDTQPNGAAGTIFYTLNFTNVGQRCTMRGYPGISAIDRTGRRLGTPATRDAVKPVRTVTLDAPNASHGTFSSAHATVGIVETGVFSQSVCRPTIASGLRVYPPDQSAAAMVSYPFGACARSGPKFLKISAVTR